MGALRQIRCPRRGYTSRPSSTGETIEKDRSAFKGQMAFFRDYAIKGQRWGT